MRRMTDRLFCESDTLSGPLFQGEAARNHANDRKLVEKAESRLIIQRYENIRYAEYHPKALPMSPRAISVSSLIPNFEVA